MFGGDPLDGDGKDLFGLSFRLFARFLLDLFGQQRRVLARFFFQRLHQQFFRFFAGNAGKPFKDSLLFFARPGELLALLLSSACSFAPMRAFPLLEVAVLFVEEIELSFDVFFSLVQAALEVLQFLPAFAGFAVRIRGVPAPWFL